VEVAFAADRRGSRTETVDAGSAGGTAGRSIVNGILAMRGGRVTSAAEKRVRAVSRRRGGRRKGTGCGAASKIATASDLIGSG